jgi:hypothetical protein
MPRMHGEHKKEFAARQLAKALLGGRTEIKFEPLIVLVCTCRSFRFAHDPEEHKKLKSDMDWRSYEQRKCDALRYREWEPSIA